MVVLLAGRGHVLSSDVRATVALEGGLGRSEADVGSGIASTERARTELAEAGVAVGAGAERRTSFEV